MGDDKHLCQIPEKSKMTHSGVFRRLVFTDCRLRNFGYKHKYKEDKTPMTY